MGLSTSVSFTHALQTSHMIFISVIYLHSLLFNAPRRHTLLGCRLGHVLRSKGNLQHDPAENAQSVILIFLNLNANLAVTNDVCHQPHLE